MRPGHVFAVCGSVGDACTLPWVSKRWKGSSKLEPGPCRASPLVENAGIRAGARIACLICRHVLVHEANPAVGGMAFENGSWVLWDRCSAGRYYDRQMKVSIVRSRAGGWPQQGTGNVTQLSSWLRGEPPLRLNARSLGSSTGSWVGWHRHQPTAVAMDHRDWGASVALAVRSASRAAIASLASPSLPPAGARSRCGASELKANQRARSGTTAAAGPGAVRRRPLRWHPQARSPA